MKLADALNGVTLLAFDTTPLVYFIEQNPNYIALMRPIMRAIASQQIMGTASVLTLAEVLVHPLQTNNRNLAQQYEMILTSSLDFQLVPISVGIARKTAELRVNYNLKTPDALHIASAIQSNSDAFVTNDKGLRRVTEIKILLLGDLEL